MNKTFHTTNTDGLYIGPIELDDSYRIPFTTDQWSRPYGSVDFAPPPTGPREIARINEERTAWDVIPDWRGHTYWTAHRESVTIKDAGETPPEGALDADPGPSLEDLKTSRIRILSDACAAAIVDGFISDALGLPHGYPCKLTDQANLQASVSMAREVADTDPEWRAPFWCQDITGNWDYRLHTAEQIRKVGMDGYMATLGKLQRKGQLEAQIMAAQTPEEVKAVVWDEAEAQTDEGSAP